MSKPVDDPAQPDPDADVAHGGPTAAQRAQDAGLRADGSRVWQPRWSAYARGYGHLFVFVALPGLIGIFVAAWLQFGLIGLEPLIAIVVAAVTYIALMMTFDRVTIIGDRLAHRNPVGVQRSWLLDEAALAVITTDLKSDVRTQGAQPPPANGLNLFVFGRSGQRLFRLAGGIWTLTQLQSIAAALPNATTDLITQSMHTAQLERLHPNSIRRAELHPFWWSLIIALLLVAGIFVWGWFAFGPGSPGYVPGTADDLPK
ncbi:MAG: hypothetical protein ABIS08_03490 [Pseudolysinimonas sp.]